jgi:hypothetical protein
LKKMILSSDISMKTSIKTIPRQKTQQSEKPQQQANLTIRSPQKKAQQIENSNNMEASCVNTSQLVHICSIRPRGTGTFSKGNNGGSEAPSNEQSLNSKSLGNNFEQAIAPCPNIWIHLQTKQTRKCNSRQSLPPNTSPIQSSATHTD